MTSKITYKGKVSVGVVVPAAGALAGAASAAIPAEIASLQALLAAAPKLAVRLGIKPPSLAANLEAAVAILTNIAAAVGVSPPSLSVQGVVALGLAAKLTARIDAIEKALDLARTIEDLDVGAGVTVVVYEGPLRHLGLEARRALGANPAAPLYIPILVCDEPGAKGSVQKAFKVA